VYLLAIAAIGVYGVTLGGWASNNKYSFLGGLRASAGMISYEIPMGLAILAVLLLSGSIIPGEIVRQQADGVWFMFAQPLAAILMYTCILAECNRAPFDNAEAEQELVGGFHTEYSSLKFALFFLAEYMNMILIAVLTAIMFLGGWLSPWPLLNTTTILGFAPFGDGIAWLLAKMSLVLLFFLWIRATFPRYRYDQVMRLGWKVFIPVTLVWIVFLGAMMQTRYAHLFH